MSAGFWKRFRRDLRVRAIVVTFPLMRWLPLWLGGFFGALAWYLVPRQRRLAQQHLAIAFPEKTAAERDVIGRESFASLGRSALESARGDPRIIYVAPEDEALLRRVHAQGRGVVLAAGHIGNWELCARRLAAIGLPSAVVAKEPPDPRLVKLLESMRSGVRILWRGSPMSARAVYRFLKEGGMLAVLIDQDTDVAGHFVPFFGKPAFTPRAAGDLAVRTGAPMVFGCAHRLPDGTHRAVVKLIDPPRTGDADADSLALTVEATRAIESEIRAHPAQWVWMHPRWRHQPVEITDENASTAERK